MFTMEKLTIVSLLASFVAIAMSSAALWPQSKQWISKFRDAVLWFIFIFVIVGAMTYGWRILEEPPRTGQMEWTLPDEERLGFAESPS